MSAILRILNAVTPPPPRPAPREFNGFEVRWKAFVLRPSEFVFEGMMLAVLGLYVFIYLIGKTINQLRAISACVMSRSSADASR